MTRARGFLFSVPAMAVLLVLVAVLYHDRSTARRALLMRTDADAVLRHPAARAVALHDGGLVFKAHCAGCHGKDGRGSAALAIPDLTDGDFLYGEGKASEIEQIVLHGIRAGDTKGWNLAEMPGFAKRVPYTREALLPLSPPQIRDLIAFLRAANGSGEYTRTQVDSGRKLFTGKAGCWDCHGPDGAGDSAIGAPNLVDGHWLSGNGSAADLMRIIERGMAGVSPAFAHKLSPYEARTVAVYAAALHDSATGGSHDPPRR